MELPLTPKTSICFLTAFILDIFWGGLFWAACAAHGGFQASGQTGATAASLHQSHSNMGFASHLQPTPQLMATLDS